MPLPKLAVSQRTTRDSHANPPFAVDHWIIIFAGSHGTGRSFDSEGLGLRMCITL